MEDKDVFLRLVMDTLEKHPEWNTDVVQAMTYGITNRLQKEIDQRAKVETSLVMCYDIAKNKLPEHHKEVVKEAIKTSFSYGGSKYAESL